MATRPAFSDNDDSNSDNGRNGQQNMTRTSGSLVATPLPVVAPEAFEEHPLIGSIYPHTHRADGNNDGGKSCRDDNVVR